MHLTNSRTVILIVTILSHQSSALFQPQASPLPYPDDPSLTARFHRNYGLFDRPVPSLPAIPVPAQQDLTNQKRDLASILAGLATAVPTNQPPTSAASLATATATAQPSIASAIVTAAPTGAYQSATGTGGSGDYGTAGGGGGGLSDTYMLPPQYNSAQLNSLFGAESSVNAAASTLLAAGSKSSGIECTGVKDVDGATVTLCGPTGNPSATWRVKSEGGLNAVGCGLAVLGGLGAVVAFFL